jgi:hypothetical protein
MMRVLSWAQGDCPKRGTGQSEFDLADAVVRHGRVVCDHGAPAPNQRLVDEYLVRAADKISNLRDWQLTIRLKDAPTGRVRDTEIVIVIPVDDPAYDDRAIEVRSTSWRRASRPSRKLNKRASVPGSRNAGDGVQVDLAYGIPLSGSSPDSERHRR